jgi:hypothetical protein
VGIPEGAECASQALCGTPRIKTYSADPHKSRSDPNQNCRPFLLVGGGLLRSNGAIDCRGRARERGNGITSSLRGDRLSERRCVGAIIERGI